jgi:hypothetical protein
MSRMLAKLKRENSYVATSYAALYILAKLLLRTAARVDANQVGSYWPFTKTKVESLSEVVNVLFKV